MNKLMDFLRSSLITLKKESVSEDEAAHELLTETDSTSAGMGQIVTSFEEIRDRNEERDKLLASANANIVRLNEEAATLSSQCRIKLSQKNGTQRLFRRWLTTRAR